VLKRNASSRPKTVLTIIAADIVTTITLKSWGDPF
jgi:hypothetical protein